MEDSWDMDRESIQIFNSNVETSIQTVIFSPEYVKMWIEEKWVLDIKLYSMNTWLEHMDLI